MRRLALWGSTFAVGTALWCLAVVQVSTSFAPTSLCVVTLSQPGPIEAKNDDAPLAGQSMAQSTQFEVEESDSLYRAPAQSIEPPANGTRIPAASVAAADSPDSAKRPLAECINVNTAGDLELQSLPGIGPALAERILADRTANGPFTDRQSFERVKGIGKATIEKLKDHICF